MNIDSHLSLRLKVYNQGFPNRFSKIMLVGEFKDWKGALPDIVREDNLSQMQHYSNIRLGREGSCLV